MLTIEQIQQYEYMNVRMTRVRISFVQPHTLNYVFFFTIQIQWMCVWYFLFNREHCSIEKRTQHTLFTFIFRSQFITWHSHEHTQWKSLDDCQLFWRAWNVLCVYVRGFFSLFSLLSISLIFISLYFKTKIFWFRKQTCTFIGSWAFNFDFAFQVVNEFSIMKFQLVWHTKMYRLCIQWKR